MFFLVVFCLVFKNPLLSAGRTRFLKINKKTKKKNKNLDQFLTYTKANLGPVFNFTAYMYIYIYQGQILAVWILAAKLPKSDLNFAVDLGVDFFSCLFQGKRPEKNPPKPPQNSLGTLFGKIPLGFLQKPFLDNRRFPIQATCHSNGGSSKAGCVETAFSRGVGQNPRYKPSDRLKPREASLLCTCSSIGAEVHIVCVYAIR